MTETPRRDFLKGAATTMVLSSLPFHVRKALAAESWDVVIVGGAVAYNYLIKPVEGEPTWISKINTLMLLLFLLFVLSRAAFAWPEKITLTVIGAATMVTVVISGFDYVMQWADRARKGV